MWGVYSYGYNTRWDGWIEYFPVFDRRHNINLVGSYSFGAKRDIELNVRWNLGSDYHSHRQLVSLSLSHLTTELPQIMLPIIAALFQPF